MDKITTPAEAAEKVLTHRWKLVEPVDGGVPAIYPDTGKMEFPVATKPDFIRVDVWMLIAEQIVTMWNTRIAPGETYQARVQPWMMECFGAVIAGDREERNHRFLEEALELVQSCGCTASEAHQLVDYVYGRDIGDPAQEVGGVMVTLAALCLANDLDMHASGETELARIWTKVEAIRAKQAAKPKHSPLPIAPSSADAGERESHWLKKRIAEIVEEDGGCWRACSGCQESCDGCVSSKDYPYNDIFKCQPGGGCRECGGIGVLWEDGAFLRGYADPFVADLASAALAAKPAAADDETPSSADAGKVVHPIIALAYKVISGEVAGGLTARFDGDSRYVIMPWRQYKHDLNNRFERGKAAALAAKPAGRDGDAK